MTTNEPSPSSPPNKWNFEDTKVDSISFPRGLTREQRKEHIKLELERYDRERYAHTF